MQSFVAGEEGVPVQVDGEAWVQSPGMIRIIHKNRMKMLCRNKVGKKCLSYLLVPKYKFRKRFLVTISQLLE